MRDVENRPNSCSPVVYGRTHSLMSRFGQPSIFRSISRRLAVLLVLALMWPARAEAGHGKVDRIQKSNGDIVTCEVLSLVRGVLKVKTDGMGTITIEWNKVSLITSPAIFEVELASGIRY